MYKIRSKDLTLKVPFPLSTVVSRYRQSTGTHQLVTGFKYMEQDFHGVQGLDTYAEHLVSYTKTNVFIITGCGVAGLAFITV